MPKLPVLSGKEVCTILARHGFVEVRRSGSHIVMQKKKDSGTTTVHHTSIRPEQSGFRVVSSFPIWLKKAEASFPKT